MVRFDLILNFALLFWLFHVIFGLIFVWVLLCWVDFGSLIRLMSLYGFVGWMFCLLSFVLFYVFVFLLLFCGLYLFCFLIWILVNWLVFLYILLSLRIAVVVVWIDILILILIDFWEFVLSVYAVVYFGFGIKRKLVWFYVLEYFCGFGWFWFLFNCFVCLFDWIVLILNITAPVVGLIFWFLIDFYGVVFTFVACGYSFGVVVVVMFLFWVLVLGLFLLICVL